MKKQMLIFLLALTLTACGADDFSTVIVTTGHPDPSAEDSEEPIVEAIPDPAPKSEQAYYAFGKVLWDAYQQGVLPDGTELEWFGAESAAENSFALYDVDSDGQEELLLIWTNTSMAGTRLDVFGYRDDAVFTELSISPFETFYDNGVVVDKWSHNQGLAGNTDFWPYFIHLYDAESGIYQNVGAVDAWSREHPASAERFPADIDTDGDGMVYFLLPANETWHYEDNHFAYTPVDGPEYEAWRSSYLDGAQPLDIASHTQKLTEDNITALGCPKPDISVQEAAG